MRSLGAGDPDIQLGPTGCQRSLSILYHPQSFGYSAGIEIMEERVNQAVEHFEHNLGIPEVTNQIQGSRQLKFIKMDGGDAGINNNY